MNSRESADLDNYITGHYGEDAFGPCEDTQILLERREKQLARVLRTARRDGDVLRDLAKVLFGQHSLSQSGIIRMFDQYMELARREDI
jgi:hypothetical protein